MKAELLKESAGNLFRKFHVSRLSEFKNTSFSPNPQSSLAADAQTTK
jgi:hypothetical protein